MRNNFSNEFRRRQEILKPKIILWFKRIYVVAFNIYAWYWIYRQIFIRHSTDYEDYLLWFFTTAGMYYFVLDNNDLSFKITDNDKTSDREKNSR
jgi:hypothetical protein